MATIGIRELKTGLSAAIRRASEGEEITVTQHGKPVARIMPLQEPDFSDHVKELIRTGKVEYRPWRAERIGPGIRLKPGKKTAVDYVLEQRR